MELTDLPLDLFLAIVSHLSARTVVLCRRVSQTWQVAFTTEEVSLQLLKDRFPRCRELRLAYLRSGGDISALAAHHPHWSGACNKDKVGDDVSKAINTRNEDCYEHEHIDWATTFALVARRYHHLRTATPRTITKLRLGTTNTTATVKTTFLPSFFPVAPCAGSHLHLNGRTAPFHHPDPSWCYDQDLGVLVYHTHPDNIEDSPRACLYPWRLLDVETGSEVEIAFPHDADRVVRRVRLCEGMLVFEWCERTPYYCARNADERHRHYVTALDVVPAAAPMKWDTVLRAEWYVFGMRLNDTDRFLSAHTASHYALYLLHNNHNSSNAQSYRGPLLPVEHALVWDMSSKQKPPVVVRHLNPAALQFYGVRQKYGARLRGLGLDGRSLFFLEEEHRWSGGGGGGRALPRAHLVRSTGVPVIPGPVVVSGWEREDEEEEGGGGVVVVEGPRWRDECGADGDVHLSFCTRINQPVRSCSQEDGDFSTDGGGPGIWNGSLLPTPTPSFAQEIHSAVRASSTRWPGWAPCWRHEDFPYLTMSEMVDFKAGVRIVARNCFMLETLSVHTRPSLSVRGHGVSGASGGASVSSPSTAVGAVDEIAVGGGLIRAAAAPSKASAGRVDTEEWESADGGGDEEVHFADEMWEQLLGAGYICGDERWLIGESDEMGGSITIARF